MVFSPKVKVRVLHPCSTARIRVMYDKPIGLITSIREDWYVACIRKLQKMHISCDIEIISCA